MTYEYENTLPAGVRAKATRPFLKIYFIYHSNDVDSGGKTSVVCSQPEVRAHRAE
jgi:hypothetical protein